MKNKITDLEPAIVWKYFNAITQIPRPSGYETKVIQYIENFALKLRLNFEIDGAGNLIIRKPATSGYENAKTIVLQSHVDMVPQKNSSKEHDFTKDAIQTIIDGEWVRADDTTLGADNGIGVAAAMAVLASADIKHGPLEVLLTINEEAGMEGAFGLEEEALKADILLNLDSEDEGEMFVGCAGGIDANVSWNYNEEQIDGQSFLIKLSGLKGGHSGIDILLKRANANKTLARLMLILYRECGARISSYSGGDMRNAIPREAKLEVVIPADRDERFHELLDEYRGEIESKFGSTDPDFCLEAEATGKANTVMNEEDQRNILNALNSCPDGVINMSLAIPGVVQTSTNLAIVKLTGGAGEAQLLLRSSDDKEKHDLAAQIKGLFELSGAKVDLAGEYPGWQPNSKSDILAKSLKTYENLYASKPKVKVIHAGLECGIIGGKFPKMDMISFGPTIRFPHSPDEKVHIKSVEKFWVFLKELLAQK